MALTSKEQDSKNLEKAGVTQSTDQERLSEALCIASARLAAYRGKIRRAVAVVDQFDGHETAMTFRSS